MINRSIFVPEEQQRSCKWDRKPGAAGS